MHFERLTNTVRKDEESARALYFRLRLGGAGHDLEGRSPRPQRETANAHLPSTGAFWGLNLALP